MGMDGVFDWRAEAASALDWWRDAGVDVLVDDAPRDWTARDVASPANTPAADTPRLPEPEPEVPLPSTLEGYLHWRFGSDAPESAWGEPILHPAGDPTAPLMIFTDLPETGDAESETLLSGSAGRLFDRMLAAIGHSRDSVYIVPLCAARPITGQVPRDAEARLGELARHHVALAAPKQLLLLGQAASRAWAGADSGGRRGSLQPVNDTDGQSMIVATFTPRFLLEKPAAKADAWKDLQLLIGEQKP